MKKETKNIIITICVIIIPIVLFGLYLWYRVEPKAKDQILITQDDVFPSEDELLVEWLKRNATAEERLELEKWFRIRRISSNLSSSSYEKLYDDIRKKIKELSKQGKDEFINKNPNKIPYSWSCPTCRGIGWLLVRGKIIHVYTCSEGHLWEK